MLFLGIGSNLNSSIGNRYKNLKKAIHHLNNHPHIWVIEQSYVYQSPAMYQTEQDDFYNMVVEIDEKETGTVLQVGDGIARVHGLEKVQMTLARRACQALANIFMGNDGYAIFKYLVAKSVVPVIMRIDCIKDGKIRLFTNFFQHLVCFIGSDPGIHNNDSLTGYEKGSV